MLVIWLYLGLSQNSLIDLISPLGRPRPLYLDSLIATAIGLDFVRILRPISVTFTLELMSVLECFL